MNKFVACVLSVAFCLSFILGLSVPAFATQQSASADNQPVLIALYMDDFMDEVELKLGKTCETSGNLSVYDNGRRFSYVCSMGGGQDFQDTCKELKGSFDRLTNRWQPDYYEEVCRF